VKKRSGRSGVSSRGEISPTVPGWRFLVPSDNRRLAVLPSPNMSGDPSRNTCRWSCRGDPHGDLAGCPALVIARNRASPTRGAPRPCLVVERVLVTYVLEVAAARRSKPSYHTVALDTTTARHIGRPVDGGSDDIEWQYQVASSVVGALEPKLRCRKSERATRRPTEKTRATIYTWRARVSQKIYRGEHARGIQR